MSVDLLKKENAQDIEMLVRLLEDLRFHYRTWGIQRKGESDEVGVNFCNRGIKELRTNGKVSAAIAGYFLARLHPQGKEYWNRKTRKPFFQGIYLPDYSGVGTTAALELFKRQPARILHLTDKPKQLKPDVKVCFAESVEAFDAIADRKAVEEEAKVKKIVADAEAGPLGQFFAA